MYLACVEIAACSSYQSFENRVLEVEFDDLEPAKVWATEESRRRDDATGNAAVFETAGPLMVLAWERPTLDAPAISVERLPRHIEADRSLLSA